MPQRLQASGRGRAEKQKKETLRLPSCDPGGARTLDPLIKSQLLYQLSYGVIMCAIVQLRMQRYKHFFNYQQYFKKNRPQYLLFYPKTHQIAPTSNHFHPKKRLPQPPFSWDSVRARAFRRWGTRDFEQLSTSHDSIKTCQGVIKRRSAAARQGCGTSCVNRVLNPNRSLGRIGFNRA